MEILSLKNSYEGPWCICGDFNIIKSTEEKIGDNLDYSGMALFIDFINSMELVNLPLSGGLFTWSDNRAFPTMCHLDRFLVSDDIMLKFPAVIQRVLPRSTSDHNPISLSVNQSDWGPKPFKLFSHWLENKDFISHLQESWKQIQDFALPNTSLFDKIKKLKHSIKAWQEQHHEDDSKRILQLENDIDQMEKVAEQRQLNIFEKANYSALKSDLWKLRLREEQSWLQKSRLKWTQLGDRNTRFFHLTASNRIRVNCIQHLQCNGFTTDDPNIIKNEVVPHFSNFFKKQDTLKLRQFNCPLNSISPEQKLQLEAPFTEDEIWNAVQQCDGNKAPGPDGFNMDIFKKQWSIFKTDIISFMAEFFRTGKLNPKFNALFITLVPKVSSPSSIAQYRPISLVGSAYKILAKVLAVKLKSVINSVVGNNQFAFVKGRQILDCSLIANELVYSINKSKKAGFLFKADFEKAFDSVDWNYLDFIMKIMGFGAKWRKWIHQCISTASISVLLNGSPSHQFKTHRGLRQGCLLSPFLFNIVVESLSSLFHQAVAKGLFEGIKIENTHTIISHLQFADDTFYSVAPNLISSKTLPGSLEFFKLFSASKLTLRKAVS
ncbi:Reverse transcriptase domain - like 10 [Theobroma cacao]|nr:Reverse transcriptase domain - like 10 [Theobroma cacao]